MGSEMCIRDRDWFRANVDGGDQILDALITAVGEAEAELEADYASDLN